MTYENTNGIIYSIKTAAKGTIKTLIGPESYTNTDRIDDNTVADLTYTFDIQQGQYVEQSRVERAEPLPPEPLTQEQEIAELRAENITLKLALADLAETQEAEKLATQLALAELAEMIAGGE